MLRPRFLVNIYISELGISFSVYSRHTVQCLKIFPFYQLATEGKFLSIS